MIAQERVEHDLEVGGWPRGLRKTSWGRSSDAQDPSFVFANLCRIESGGRGNHRRPRHNSETRAPIAAVQERQRKYPLHSKGSRRTPGGIRDPMPLIRRRALIITNERDAVTEGHP